jgi:hypothetical protein
MVTGALFVFLFGPWIIDHLRLRLCLDCAGGDARLRLRRVL